MPDVIEYIPLLFEGDLTIDRSQSRFKPPYQSRSDEYA
jgi:hypothetical protein